MVTTKHAYCDSRRKICNRKGVKIFELGSDEDDCIDARSELPWQCRQTEELLPDCSCQKKCRPGEEREWNGEFECIDDSSRHGEKTTSESQKSVKKFSQNSSQKIDNNLKGNDPNFEVIDDPNEEQARSNTVEYQDTKSVTVIVIVAPFAILGLLVMLLLVMYIKRRRAVGQSHLHDTQQTSRISGGTSQENTPLTYGGSGAPMMDLLKGSQENVAHEANSDSGFNSSQQTALKAS